MSGGGSAQLPATRALELDSFGKSFGRRRILTAATVHVRAGRVCALLGRNGCGKSTLLRAALGFVRADWGTVRLEGRLVAAKLHILARSGVFFIPERDLIPRTRTVAHHLRALGRVFGREGVSAAVDRLRIAEVLDRPVRRLSSGERRRAEIAFAIARRPQWLIADELFMGIAPTDAELITTVLREMAARGCGILLTGHEIDWLLEAADDVVWLVAGTTHALGSAQQARSHDQFRREYLGPGSPAARIRPAAHATGDGVVAPPPRSHQL